MSYSSIVAMASSASLIQRVAACAAEQGISNPQAWASSMIWQLAASPGWADSWSSAVAAQNANVNPDTGARDDVITDQAILSAVQAISTPAP